MSTDDFDMRNTSRCICGHALRTFGERLMGPGKSNSVPAQHCSGFSLSKRGSYSFRPIAPRRGVTSTPIRKMRHEWCAI
jgi:hypothetical protein